MKYTTDILSEIQMWCHYADPPDPPVEEINYGALYNWYAATDARNITSAGWHLPTNAEFDILITRIGGTIGGGDKLKEISPTVWWAQSTGHETNEYGFNIRGAGYRGFTGTFTSLLIQSKLATYDLIVGSPYNYLFIGGNQSNIMQMASPGAITEKTGTSIRPLKDSTTLTHGQTGTYTDPSGYIYRTICIGNQEWVADNIKTEHYRTGDAIPVVTDNGDWAALVTGAMCYYNNDISNA